MNLPDKFVSWNIGDPYAGENFYYSGKGDNLRNEMTKAFTLPAGARSRRMVNYGIEKGYDYANLIVSTDGGAHVGHGAHEPVDSTVEANGIDGFSDGLGRPHRRPLGIRGRRAARLQLHHRRWRGRGRVHGRRHRASPVPELDGAETDAGWTFDGFKTTTGYESGYYWNYYLAEYRQYWGYDVALTNATTGAT